MKSYISFVLAAIFLSCAGPENPVQESEAAISEPGTNNFQQTNDSLICGGHYGSTDRYPVYKIRPDTFVAGYTDKNGLKQGSFFSYNDNNTVNFIRTYRNDTLNGFLGCYSPAGFVNSEGFYKNSERDSIYFEYEGENKLVSSGCYKNGLKHGKFREFHENGNLKYEGFYQDDVLIGNEVYYHRNKEVLCKGNEQNGTYRYFDSTGRMERNILYENGEIKRTQIYYPDRLKKVKPVFIKPYPFTGKNLENSTRLKVDVLYSNYETSRAKDFLTYANVSVQDSCITIRFRDQIYQLKPGGLYHCVSCMDYDSKNDIAIANFGTNRELFITAKYEEDDRFVRRDDIVDSDTYKIIVHREKPQCDDTGNNPITIEFEGKSLSIAKLKNVQVFEYDVDANGQNEIYIISFESCEGRYQILKVSQAE